MNIPLGKSWKVTKLNVTDGNVTSKFTDMLLLFAVLVLAVWNLAAYRILN